MDGFLKIGLYISLAVMVVGSVLAAVLFFKFKIPKIYALLKRGAAGIAVFFIAVTAMTSWPLLREKTVTEVRADNTDSSEGGHDEAVEGYAAEIRILDKDGNEYETGYQGEIVVRVIIKEFVEDDEKAEGCEDIDVTKCYVNQETNVDWNTGEKEAVSGRTGKAIRQTTDEEFYFDVNGLEINKDVEADDVEVCVTIEDKGSGTETSKEYKTAFNVDTLAPRILITTPDEYKDSEEKYVPYANRIFSDSFYYSQNPYVKAEVTDLHIKNGKKMICYFSEDEKAKSVKISDSGDGKAASEIMIGDGQMISNLWCSAEDEYGNKSEDKSHSDRTFIVDKTAPKAEISFSDNVESFFTRRNGKSIFIFAKLKNPVKGESGIKSTGKPEKVTLTIKIIDKNLVSEEICGETSNGEKTDYYTRIKSGFSGTLDRTDASKNDSEPITYTNEISIDADKSGYLKFGLHIEDLAGNKITERDFVIAKGQESNDIKALIDNILVDEKGEFESKVAIDRERPSSTNEFDPPEIIVTEKTPAVAVFADGRFLYAADAEYKITVTDPSDKDKGGKVDKDLWSGLKSIEYKVDSTGDAAGACSVKQGRYDLNQAKSFTDNDVVVSLADNMEANDIVLTVTVTDWSGNAITCRKYLAIDKKAPRVTVSYDNNSVQNTKYFKDDRVLSLTVEDTNFDAEKTHYYTRSGSSKWTNIGGNKWRLVINFNSDGDYTFMMETADKAGNKTQNIDYSNEGHNAASQEFIIDKTAPVITVSFDNNDVRNGKYYNEPRTCFITVAEHNFQASDVEAQISSVLDESVITSPEVGNWERSGDNSIASAVFTNDGDYGIKVNYTDLAGNRASEADGGEFTIDRTAPELTISNVENGKAYRGDIAPEVTFTDINFDGNGWFITWSVEKIDGVKSILNGKNPDNDFAASDSMGELSLGEELSVHGDVTNIRHGRKFSFKNLDEDVENDGIYCLSAMAYDLAGNEYSAEPVIYSVNRFGSTFKAYDTKTGKLIDSYVNLPSNVKILEINPDRIVSNEIAIEHNEQIRTLNKGEDYSVRQIKEKGILWNEYLYDINSSVFEDQGEYRVTVMTEDEAGNRNTNRTSALEKRNLEFGFVMDKEAPSGYINVTGLSESSGNRIDMDSAEVNAFWEDNYGTEDVRIFIKNGDGEAHMKAALTGEEIASGSFSFTLPESNEWYEVYEVIKDKAGNEYRSASERFLLTTNAWVRFINDKGLVLGCVIGLAVVFIGGLLVLFVKKKNNEN